MLINKARTFAATIVAGLAASLIVNAPARAGHQQYEPMSDAVRSTLSAAIRDRAAPTVTDDEGLAWIERHMAIIKRYKQTEVAAREFLTTVRYEAMRAGLEPDLVLAVIDVESKFRKYAVSSVGARGYMQVMPFWVKVLGDPNVHNLFHLRTNMRYGCQILRHYLDIEKGNVVRALGRYNGSLGKAEYPNLVLGAYKKRWAPK
jgi:soluble lytic murein transglycosylase-like protein